MEAKTIKRNRLTDVQLFKLFEAIKNDFSNGAEVTHTLPQLQELYSRKFNLEIPSSTVRRGFKMIGKTPRRVVKTEAQGRKTNGWNSAISRLSELEKTVERLTATVEWLCGELGVEGKARTLEDE